MYKILIVDDEAVVREGIKHAINWSEFGFELIGGCKNGKQAIEIIEETVPDVVITDICMPIMDGIALTKYLSECYPSIKVILLTGFDEFEYAQQAVKLKVVDFIVKPITAAEFRDVLEKMKLDLDREMAYAHHIDKLKKQLEESYDILKLRFLNQWILKPLTAEEIYEKAAYFNIDLSKKYWTVLLVDVDDPSEIKKQHPGSDDELLYLALQNMCEEIAVKWTQGVVFQNTAHQMIILMSEDQKELAYQIAMDTAQEIKELSQKHLKFTVSIGVSTATEEVFKVPIIYEEAGRALEYRFLIGGNQVIYIDDVEAEHSTSKMYTIKWMEQFISDVKMGSFKRIEEHLEVVFKRLEESFVSIEQCYLYAQQILLFMLNEFEGIEDSLKEIEQKEKSIVEVVYHYKTIFQLKDWMKEFCKQVSTNITSRKLDQFMIHALKAEEYIRQNYKNNLTLTSVCQELCLSRSYFSMIIKQHTGMTFIEYLTKLRIDKAKELLRTTSLKTYEVADEVGYEDAHYFSLIFKKGTGISPTEYRKAYD